MRISLAVTALALLHLPVAAQGPVAERGLTLESWMATNGQKTHGLNSARETTLANGTVVTNSVANHIDQPMFFALQGGEHGAVRAAKQEQDRTVPGVLTLQWNTFRPIRETDAGPTYVHPLPHGQSSGTARVWVEGRGDFRAKPGCRLFGRLIDGGRDGPELVQCSCVARQAPAGGYEVTYGVENRSREKITFRWAGFEATLKPGESFTRSVPVAAPPLERPALASVTFPDGQNFEFKANVFTRPK